MRSQGCGTARVWDSRGVGQQGQHCQEPGAWDDSKASIALGQGQDKTAEVAWQPGPPAWSEMVAGMGRSWAGQHTAVTGSGN